MKESAKKVFLFTALFLACSNPAVVDENAVRKESSPFCNHTWVYYSFQITYYNNDSTWYIGNTTQTTYSFTPDIVIRKNHYGFGEQCPQPNFVCETTFVSDSIVITCKPLTACAGMWGGHNDTSAGVWDFNSNTLFLTFHDTIHSSIPYYFSTDEDTLFLGEPGVELRYYKIEQ